MKNLLTQTLHRIFKKKIYSTNSQRQNRRRKTIIEIAKKVIEEESKTSKISDELDQKMSTFLNKKNAELSLKRQ